MIIESKLGAALRLTLLTSCQSGCDFCHLEGHKSTGQIGTLNEAIIGWRTSKKMDNAIGFEDIAITRMLAEQLNLKNVNITGGEPTLHPDAVEMIRALAQAGLSVAMTTHAEISPQSFKKFLESGLEWVILSLHAMEPEQYVAMDLVAQRISRDRSPTAALDYARVRLRNKFLNLDQALEARRCGVIEDVITNTVVMNPNTTSQIVDFCNRKGMIPRIQRDLNQRSSSKTLIDQLITNLGARPFRESRAIGDSSGAGTDFEYFDPETGERREFRLKDFGDVYIPAMCSGCANQDTDACRERFYGVRIEPGRVRTCIDMDWPQKSIFASEDFLGQLEVPGTVPFEIRRQYRIAQDGPVGSPDGSPK